VLLPLLVPLLCGLWAGFTKRPSLPWFSSPRRWVRRGGRSVLEIATFTIGVPVGVVLCGGLLPGFPRNPQILPSFPTNPQIKVILMLLVFTLPLIAFMSGAFLGNALRRVGFLGTPKEPLQGEEDVEQEEVWSPRKEAQWGLAGSIIVALASVLAAAIH